MFAELIEQQLLAQVRSLRWMFAANLPPANVILFDVFVALASYESGKF